MMTGINTWYAYPYLSFARSRNLYKKKICVEKDWDFETEIIEKENPQDHMILLKQGSQNITPDKIEK